MKSTTLGVWLAVLAGLQVIAGAGDLTNLMPSVAASWFTLLLAAAQVGTAVYTGRVAMTPADQVTLSSTRRPGRAQS